MFLKMIQLITFITLKYLTKFMEYPILDIIQHIETNCKQLGITLYKGASENKIINFEKEVGIKLPTNFQLFYKKWNGFELEEDLFRIIPLEEILENINKNDNPNLVNSIDFSFAEYMIYCDTWDVSINKKTPDNYLITNNSTELSNSLAQFLTVFIENSVDGLYEWKEKCIKIRSSFF